MKYKAKDIAGKIALSFLDNPLTPILGFMLIAIGIFALQVTPREEDPQMEVSGGSIIVPMPGNTPEEINEVIVKPLERKIKEIKGVEYVYGIAQKGVGIVNVSYLIGQKQESSNLKLYDKVMQNLNLLPQGAYQPLIKPFDIDIDIPIVNIAFYQKNDSNISFTQLFKEVRAVEQSISSIENVSKTLLRGEHKEQYNIKVDMYKLTGFHISLGQIAKSLKSLAINVPNVDTLTKDGQMVVFGIKNAIENIEDIENIIISNHYGSPIYLKDVADVSLGENIQDFRQAYIDYKKDTNKNANYEKQKRQITLEVSKLRGTNAVFIAEDVMERLEEFREHLSSKGIGYVVTRNYGQRANESVNDLVSNLLISMVIVVGLLVFVLGWRESLIVGFTVPAIFAITLFVDYLTGQTINRITLFALMVSLGMLVDAAIIVVENIHRHMHDITTKDKPKDQVILEATDEIGPATNFATVAIILTMVPMAFVGQMMGQFMKPIPYNVPVALLASLFVAYIFAPFLARKLMKKPTTYKTRGLRDD